MVYYKIEHFRSQYMFVMLNNEHFCKQESSMELNERQKKIFDLVCDNKKITTSELSKTLFVTEMTIRRDLNEMENAGYIKRYRGGAMSLSKDDSFPVIQRMLVDEDEKIFLAKKAQVFLKDNISVFIDSSSTTQFLIPYIKKFKNIKMITNSISALTIASKFNIPVFLIGGEYSEHEMCCYGHNAEKTAEKFNVDLAFVSTLGITHDGIITDSAIEIISVKERIIANAKHTVFLFEEAKIGKKGLYNVCTKDDENVSVIFSKI